MWRQQLALNFKKDLKAAQRVRLPWWGVWCCMIPALPIVLLLGRHGRLNLALPILGTVATFGVLIVLKWRLRASTWFWVTILIMAAIHIPLIWCISWTTRWVFPLLSAGIASTDFCIMLAILLVVEEFTVADRR
jgi:hypothetical protein